MISADRAARLGPMLIVGLLGIALAAVTVVSLMTSDFRVDGIAWALAALIAGFSLSGSV